LPRREATKPNLPYAARASPAPAAASGRDNPASSDATALLRHYYALIEKRDYAQALALREDNGTSLKAFAAHFDRFETMRVTIGTPSLPVHAGDWLYVEVPVQTYGAMRNGAPFGSAGTVTLRRKMPNGRWRIYTK